MELHKTLNTFLLSHGVNKKYWVGFSGGLDSHVLLHAMKALQKDHHFELSAIHVNHGVSANAVAWQQHCEAVCEVLDVPFVLRYLSQMGEQGKSPEDSLRTGRYQLFSELLNEDDVLLTAHHQNDQAETVLLQLFRGAGPKGLAAMPIMKTFAKGFHGRPLLNETRASLEIYANQHQLKWVDDESNVETSYTRNFIRHEVIPVLEKRWPSITKTLSRVASHCADAQEFIDDVLHDDIQLVKGAGNSLPNTLSISALLKLEPNRQRHLIRHWLAEKNYPIPSAAKLQQILHTILLAGADKLPHIAWRGIELRRYRDDLYVMPCLAQHDVNQVFSWDFSTCLTIKNIGILQTVKTQDQGLRNDIQSVEVRFRQGGEIIRLPGRECHHDLKKLFQSLGIPPWQRDRTPLIYVNNTLAAIVNYVVSDDFVAKKGEEGIGIVMPA